MGGHSRFFCQECGQETPKWVGRCPNCGAWNSIREEVVSKTKRGGKDIGMPPGVASPISIVDVTSEADQRYPTGIGELDRVLGGGLVPGSVILVGGDPGIGKSTLLLQTASNLSKSLAREAGEVGVLYISAEESVRQVKMRAERLGTLQPNLYLVSDTQVENVIHHIGKFKPAVAIVDSIQTVYSPELEAAPGSVSQVRECASQLVQVAKVTGTSVFLVGHVTKEGILAGPRVLEHVVDTVLYLEGERHHAFRILRAIKNRFGSTNEIGVFEMQEGGLVEVTNPSELFLAQRPAGATGSIVVASLEGTRPVLLEVQALAAGTSYGNPRRLASGVDVGRAILLIALLEKKTGLNLGSYDVYINVAGGIKTDEPAADLGICLAVASSFRNVPCDNETVVCGEVGLTGEVRAISRPLQRLQEASRLGFRRMVLPAQNVVRLRHEGDEPHFQGMQVVGVHSVREAMEVALAR